METIQGSNIFQEWAKRFAPGLYRVEGPTKFNVDPSLSMPASPTPIPSAPAISPAADPQFQEEHALDVAEGNQDQWTGPTPGAPPSLTDRFNAGLSRVGEGLKDPAKMGLLTAGLSMMATPPRRVPYSNTEILGQAGLAGVGAYEKALEAKRKDTLLSQTAEEHALAREDRRTAAEQRNEYYMGSLEERKAAQRTRDAIAADSALKNKRDTEPIGENPYGLDPTMPMWKVKDLTGLQKQLNTPDKGASIVELTIDGETRAYDKNNLPDDVAEALYNGTAKLPPKTQLVTSADGTVRIVEKIPGSIIRGAGKPMAGGATGSGGGGGARPGEKQFEFQERRAKESLMEKGNKAPSIEQVSAERQKLFPKGVTKNPRNPRAALAGATRKVKMPDGSIQEFDAAGNRVK